MPRVVGILGRNIKYFRELRGLTQSEFAKKIGKSRNTINRLERGGTWLGLKTLSEIASLLEVDEADLFRINLKPDEKDLFKEELDLIYSRLSIPARAKLVAYASVCEEADRASDAALAAEEKKNKAR
jgi:transcriptional regulator with XRE-family HTH domain